MEKVVKPRDARCRRGHLRTEKNSKKRWDRRYNCFYIQCRACSAEDKRARYMCDEVYRERQKARVKALYHTRHPRAFREIMAMVIPDKGQYLVR